MNKKEIKKRKKNLIKQIKKFDNKCVVCGKLFLGAMLYGSTEVGAYPVDFGVTSYPLSCGKCPECVKECYENLNEFIEIDHKVPCEDIKLDVTDEFEDIKYDLDCWVYLEENFQIDQLHAGNSNINGYELIDLFDIFDLS